MNNRRKQASRLGFAFAVYILAVVATQIALIPLLPRLGGIIPGEWLVLLYSSLPNYLIGVPVFFLLTRKVPAVPIKPKEPWGLGLILRYAFISLALGYIFSIIGNLMNAPFVERFGISENVLEDILSQTSTVATFVFIVIGAPVVEELVFRRRFLPRAAAFGRRQAVIAGGLAFGLFHLNIPQFAYAFVLGMFWSVVYLRHGSYLLVVILHMIVNALGTMVLPLLIGGEESRLIIVGVYVITVIVLGLILFVRSRGELAEALRDPEPALPDEAAAPVYDAEGRPIDPEPAPESWQDTAPLRRIPEKQPSLLFNPGMILYYAVVVGLFILMMAQASTLS